MPAANLYQLFAFEDQIQVAAKAVLEAAQLTPVFTRGDVSRITDAGYLVRFTRGAATGAQGQIPATALTEISNRMEFVQFQGTLDIVIALPRPSNTIVSNTDGIYREIGALIGKVSAEFLRIKLPFTGSNLPYLDVSEILPQPAEWGVDEDHNLDVCTLSWQVTFSIKQSAWPSSA